MAKLEIVGQQCSVPPSHPPSVTINPSPPGIRNHLHDITLLNNRVRLVQNQQVPSIRESNGNIRASLLDHLLDLDNLLLQRLGRLLLAVHGLASDRDADHLVLVLAQVLCQRRHLVLLEVVVGLGPQAQHGLGASLFERREDAREEVAVRRGVQTDDGRAGRLLEELQLGNEFIGGLAVFLDFVVLQRKKSERLALGSRYCCGC